MNNSLQLNRYPTTDNRSLKAWSAADEYILDYIDKNEVITDNVAIYNDRFGYLSLHLAHCNPTIIINYKSQQNAISKNATKNSINKATLTFKHPIDDQIIEPKLSLVRVPKSMDMFRLFLVHIHAHANTDQVVICSFMTKYFTKQILSIADEYFEIQKQSLAWRKSRLLILTNPKPNINTTIINKIPHINISDDEVEIHQYYGVFSARHIDYATQFLIDNINLDSNVERVLDVASGNGILAYEIHQLNPDVELHLVDDSYLANQSAAINLEHTEAIIHFTNELSELPQDYFDLVVCNPPFHFEHENTIEIALSLFHGIVQVMNNDGRLVCVANNHLNYRTHLSKIFDTVDIMAMNEKFTIYECWK